ncbi:hypothetical protein Hamer_G023041 [Homarus americanus]|uniref:Uncharacterized protein n=1 Tax=Homarus americanus TaxID=6706 RepID=A0A8J5TLL3_HOMAM|nr:hypothetical protein Hamer_G023041 [Homarus americanus]
MHLQDSPSFRTLPPLQPALQHLTVLPYATGDSTLTPSSTPAPLLLPSDLW